MFSIIDIHGFTTSEAKVLLDKTINSMNSGELKVIHGYSSSVLQTFIRKQYKHKKIVSIILTINPGETILVIK